MAKPGPAAKDRGRQRPHDLKVIALPDKAVFDEIPDPPSGLLKVTREWWAAFWESPIARMVDGPSLPMVQRLARYYDDWERAQRAARKDPYITGSQGQPVINPMIGEIDRLEKRIRALEKDLALPAYERSRLGLAQLTEQKTIADLTAELHADDDTDEDDPRALVVDIGDRSADAGG